MPNYWWGPDLFTGSARRQHDDTTRLNGQGIRTRAYTHSATARTSTLEGKTRISTPAMRAHAAKIDTQQPALSPALSHCCNCPRPIPHASLSSSNSLARVLDRLPWVSRSWRRCCAYNIPGIQQGAHARSPRVLDQLEVIDRQIDDDNHYSISSCCKWRRTRLSGKPRHGSRQTFPNEVKRPGVLGKALNRCRLLVDGAESPWWTTQHQGFSSPSSKCLPPCPPYPPCPSALLLLLLLLRCPCIVEARPCPSTASRWTGCIGHASWRSGETLRLSYRAAPPTHRPTVKCQSGSGRKDMRRKALFLTAPLRARLAGSACSPRTNCHFLPSPKSSLAAAPRPQTANHGTPHPVSAETGL